jgi:hypothetical protein
MREEGGVVLIVEGDRACLRVATAVGPDIVLIGPRLSRGVLGLLRAHPLSRHAQISKCRALAIVTSTTRNEARSSATDRRPPLSASAPRVRTFEESGLASATPTKRSHADWRGTLIAPPVAPGANIRDGRCQHYQRVRLDLQSFSRSWLVERSS